MRVGFCVRLPSNGPRSRRLQSSITRYYGEHQGDTYLQFNNYDLETRYRLYICGKQALHAPWGLEVPFARGGEEAARFLEQKLEETEHAATIYDIVVVFTTMRELGTFDASVDPALMNLIEQKIGQLDGALREYGERNLQTIRNGPPRETN